MKRLAASIGALIFLAGCATYYTPPERARTATMEFVTDLRPVTVYRFENSRCEPSREGNRLAYIDPVFHPEGTHRGPIRIEAGRDLVFTMHKVNQGRLGPVLGGYQCDITMRFIPEAGQTYQVRFSNETSSAWSPDCRVQLLRVVTGKDGGQQTVPEETAAVNAETCTSIQ